MQALAAGDQEGRLARPFDPPIERGGDVREHLLQVVEDDEAAAAPGDGVAELHSRVFLAERDFER